MVLSAIILRLMARICHFQQGQKWGKNAAAQKILPLGPWGRPEQGQNAPALKGFVTLLAQALAIFLWKGRPMSPHLTKTFFTLSFGFAALIFAVQHAQGQTPPAQAHPAQTPPTQCAPRADVLQALGSKYGEARRAIGIAGQSNVMELFANPTTGTWTITATAPNGLMCLLASGSNLEFVTDPAPAKGSPA